MEQLSIYKIKKIKIMKVRIITTVVLMLCTLGHVDAQIYRGEADNTLFTWKRELPEVLVNKNVTTHFISKEKLEYVDISTADIAGDIANDRLLRIKPLEDAEEGEYILTIVGETYFQQYRLILDEEGEYNAPTEVRINDSNKLDRDELRLTESQLHDLSLKIYMGDKKGNNNMIRTKKYGILSTLNNIYVHGDYIFLDVILRNKTNLAFTFDQVTFSIKDSKVTKATNSQEKKLQPVYTYMANSRFENSFRNIYVFRKFTFPDDKTFSIEFNEEQTSGRQLELLIDYQDLLRAKRL